MTEDRLRTLLQPFTTAPGKPGDRTPHTQVDPLPDRLYGQLLTYLTLLVRWNARTNLTAIREEDEIVTRHFGESIFTALHIRGQALPGATLLDVGSGAGFPGLPMQLVIPELAVTLAESQGKKAAFLREAVRTLGVPTEVWAARVESMPAERQFSFVALRAVDNMDAMRRVAAGKLAPQGSLLELAGGLSTLDEQLMQEEELSLPGGRSRVLRIWGKDSGRGLHPG